MEFGRKASFGAFMDLVLYHVQVRELWSASEEGDVEAVTSIITTGVDLDAKDRVRCSSMSTISCM